MFLALISKMKIKFPDFHFNGYCRYFDIAASVAISISCTSQAQALDSVTFAVTAPEVLPKRLLVAKRSKDLLSLTLHSTRAVRLDSALEGEDGNSTAINKGFPLNAGQILAGSVERPEVFCAPIISRGLGMAGPCLFDRDADGKFDVIGKGGFIDSFPDAVIIDGSQKPRIFGIKYTQLKPLKSPIAYSFVAASSSPAAPGRLRWQSDYREDQPGKPIKLKFFIEASAYAITKMVNVIFSGQPVEVNIEGISLRVLGFQPAGEMEFEFLNVPVQHDVTFEYIGRGQTMMIIY